MENLYFTDTSNKKAFKSHPQATYSPPSLKLNHFLGEFPKEFFL